MPSHIEGKTKWLIKKDRGTAWVLKTADHINNIIGRGFFPNTPNSGKDNTELEPYLIELVRYETVPKTNITTHDLATYYEETVGVALVIMVDSVELQPFALQLIDSLQGKPPKKSSDLL